MRHAVPSGVVLLGGATAVPLAVALLGPPGARPAPVPAAALSRDDGRAAAGPRVVEYRGLRVPVPAGWEVHDLDRNPATCVRYDRHAVYLGRPGPQPDCPARIVGRTEALHLQPAERGARPRGEGRLSRTVVHTNELATVRIAATVDHETRLSVPEAGVSITGVYGTDPAPLQRLLRGTRVTANRPADPPPEPSDSESEQSDEPELPGLPELSGTDLQPGESGAGSSEQSAEAELDRPWAKGKGFDTCTAPSLAAMKAWRPSFKITNIYIGGAARGCAQPNLTKSWVSQVRAMGYRITPTYVGLQAPCGSRPQKFTTKNAAAQGAKAAVDAASRAQNLGIPEGAPIYFDMEAYKAGKGSCKASVLRFVDNWVSRLKEEGYEPCLYSSVKSAIVDVGKATGINKPVAVWFANWNGRAAIYGDPFMPDDWWSPHRRIKQYRGGHKETHGGVRLNIDSNVADGRVY